MLQILLTVQIMNSGLFDYLRDNMVVDENQMVQRELNYCIADESTVS